VFTTNGYVCGVASDDLKVIAARKTSGYFIAEILELLSRLPNLKHLTIDLHQTLPLQALCFIVNAPRLKSLHLENVQLIGSFNETAGILTKFAQWRELTLSHCRGSSALDLLLSVGLPSSLQKLTIANTCLGRTSDSCTHETLKALVVANSQLQTLRLLDLPNIYDKHVHTLVQALASLHPICLQELEFTSNIAGQASGEALTRLLIEHPTQVERLRLHLDWESCGPTVAHLLLNAQHPLKDLDLRLYGDDTNVREDAMDIAETLALTSASLKRLCLYMEMEPDKEVTDSIMEAFEDMLFTNDTLKCLVVHDGMEPYALPDAVSSKLKLNCSGAPKLWKRRDAASHAQFVQTLINQKDDIDTLFHILSNQPTLCDGTGRTSVVGASPHDKTETMEFQTKSVQAKLSLSPKRTTHSARKFIKKQMKSIFAKSA
jgi:hypothetical protein